MLQVHVRGAGSGRDRSTEQAGDGQHDQHQTGAEGESDTGHGETSRWGVGPFCGAPVDDRTAMHGRPRSRRRSAGRQGTPGGGVGAPHHAGQGGGTGERAALRRAERSAGLEDRPSSGWCPGQSRDESRRLRGTCCYAPSRARDGSGRRGRGGGGSRRPASRRPSSDRSRSAGRCAPTPRALAPPGAPGWTRGPPAAPRARTRWDGRSGAGERTGPGRRRR